MRRRLPATPAAAVRGEEDDRAICDGSAERSETAGQFRFGRRSFRIRRSLAATASLHFALPTPERAPMFALASVLLLPVVSQPEGFDAAAAADAMIEEVRPMLDNPKKTMRLLVTFEVKADKEEEFVELFRMATLKTRQEEGNITYMMSKVDGTLGGEANDNPTYVLFETWKSLDALDEHMHMPYLAEVLGKLPDLTVSSKIQVMTPQLTQEHRKAGRGDAGGADNSGVKPTGRRMKKKQNADEE